MKQLFFRLIYQRQINFLIRSVLKLIRELPERFKIPPSGRIKVKTRSTDFILATNQTCYVTHLLFWEGAEKFEYSSFFIFLINRVTTFYDIGANIGYYSLLATATNSRVQVKAFEPALGPHHYLSKNVVLNKSTARITIEEIALSDKTGEIEFQEVKNQKYSYLNYNLSGEGNLVEKKTAKSFNKRIVETKTLDSYCFGSQTFPELIKIDTEGAEALVLSGSSEVFSKYRPILICEILYNGNEPEIDNYFAEIGEYSRFALNGSILIPLDTITRQEDNGYRDFVFLPNEKKHLLSDYNNII